MTSSRRSSSRMTSMSPEGAAPSSAGAGSGTISSAGTSSATGAGASSTVPTGAGCGAVYSATGSYSTGFSSSVFTSFTGFFFPREENQRVKRLLEKNSHPRSRSRTSAPVMGRPNRLDAHFMMRLPQAPPRPYPNAEPVPASWPANASRREATKAPHTAIIAVLSRDHLHFPAMRRAEIAQSMTRRAKLPRPKHSPTRKCPVL